MKKRNIWLGVAVSLALALSAEAAFAATITLTPTCSFAKAVAWVNTPGTPQSGCSRSGSFGNNDTIIVGLNNQEFTIDSTVEIKKSLTIQNWSFYGTLKTTNPSLATAIKVAARDIVVHFIAIVLRGVAGNKTTGLWVDGTADTHESSISKVVMDSSRIADFGRTGIYIYQGGVTLNGTTLDNNINPSSLAMGGAVRIETTTKYGELDAVGCLFSGNRAWRGGAIYNHGVANIKESRFSGNRATTIRGDGSGAVIYAVRSTVNYYTAFSAGGDFDSNVADFAGYPISAGDTTEFADDTPFTAAGNFPTETHNGTLCENAVGEQGCPTQQQP